MEFLLFAKQEALDKGGTLEGIAGAGQAETLRKNTNLQRLSPDVTPGPFVL